MSGLSSRDLEQFEAAKGITLPPVLREVLLTEGPGFYGPVELYHPDDIEERYAPFFDDPAELFSLYLPFGELERSQELLVYRTSDGAWARIWHEYIPEMWPEQEWQPLTMEAINALRSGT